MKEYEERERTRKEMWPTPEEPLNVKKIDEKGLKAIFDQIAERRKKRIESRGINNRSRSETSGASSLTKKNIPVASAKLKAPVNTPALQDAASINPVVKISSHFASNDVGTNLLLYYRLIHPRGVQTKHISHYIHREKRHKRAVELVTTYGLDLSIPLHMDKLGALMKSEPEFGEHALISENKYRKILTSRKVPAPSNSDAAESSPAEGQPPVPVKKLTSQELIARAAEWRKNKK
ncbi:MAG: hypothetical protein WC408_04935 [Candidatus Micrarchaeia archaeon]